MINRFFENIERNREVRQNLIGLREALKTEKGRTELRQQMDTYVQVLTGLLEDADAKVRKNAALILGETGRQQVLGQLYEAYAKEQQLFVRSSYLTAMSHLDFRPYMDQLEQRLQELLETEMTTENQKHLNEELRLLREMLLMLKTPKKHRFTGYSVPSDMILLTSPGIEKLTFDVLPSAVQQKARMMSGGVRVQTDRLGDLLGIRTMKGILFRFCRNPLAANDYESVADAVYQAGVVEYLKRRHEGEGPFYFRIDLRTRLVLNEKSQYVKRLAARLEQLSGHQLQNSASNYECTLRIVENKQGNYSVYLELNTLPDTRFAYRKHALATSMHPVRAAEIIALARDYMTSDAVVLDPFCGTGTLLIERQRALRAKNLYGVDIYGEAIELACENAELAHVPVYFVNRDFAEFTHKYRFDEIVTELPAQSDKLTADMLYRLYRQFVKKLDEWMQPAGHVIVCTTEPSWLKELAELSGYLRVETVHSLSGKRAAALMVLKYRG